MHWRERTPCGELRECDVGREVFLAGWVDARRDHGDLLFVHLRDWTGIVQVVFQGASSKDLVTRAQGLREETCAAIRGKVVRRESGTENPSLKTGTLEVLASALTVLNPSALPPFPLSEKAMTAGAQAGTPALVAEDLRLQYRYLDLRRPSLQANLIQRHHMIRAARDFLHQQGFIEVETPCLTKSTPEGARDYIVPSRIHSGAFYALPQSPQLFKQLLMIGGVERYYQVARCFRDEDLRPNRQPEFTQLDIEAAFIDETFFYERIEEVVARMFAVAGIDLPRPFPRLAYREAIAATGSDRPDLRFGLRFVEATDLFRQTSYSIFQQVLKRDGRILGINVKGQSEALSKNVLQNEVAKQIVPGFGGKGMTWMRMTDGRLDSNIVQFFSPAERQAIVDRFQCENGDVLMLIADPSYPLAAKVLGQLRLHVADRLGLIPPDTYRPVWVTDFPLFEPLEDGKVTSTHHPFTAPDRTDFDPRDREALLSLKSRAYDIVLNGEELGGGSIRIHQRSIQQKVFAALGLTDEEVKNQFGFFLQAFDFGAPPHGGIALGIDRIAAMALGAPSIRDVIAFPKNRSAFCPLTQAPSPVAPEQLAELGFLASGKAETAPSLAEENGVQHLSWVARIGLREGEIPLIEDALEEAEALARQVQTKPSAGEPLFSPIDLENRTRPGDRPVAHPAASNRELLRNAPAVKGDFFKVANILESPPQR